MKRSGPLSSKTRDPRSRLLAALHMAARKKGLIQDAAGGADKTAYVAWLNQVADVDSAADLDLDELRRVLNLLSPRAANQRATVGPEKQALVNKIHAQLGSAGRSPKYADAMARRMFRVAMFEWCTPQQLHSIVAALECDRRRRS